MTGKKRLYKLEKRLSYQGLEAKNLLLLESIDLLRLSFEQAKDLFQIDGCFSELEPKLTDAQIIDIINGGMSTLTDSQLRQVIELCEA